MSREALLDEAIYKAKEAEDWQLVEWLRMARGGESAARWYTEKLRGLEDENAKLRELVRDMRTCIDHACMCEFCPLFVTEEDMDERRCIADIKAHMRELVVDE